MEYAHLIAPWAWCEPKVASAMVQLVPFGLHLLVEVVKLQAGVENFILDAWDTDVILHRFVSELVEVDGDFALLFLLYIFMRNREFRHIWSSIWRDGAWRQSKTIEATC